MPVNHPVDQFSDPSFKTLASRIKEVPEYTPFIKSAQLNMEEHASLPDSAFAWEDQRLFPLHTPEQAALSYLYATSKTASVPETVIKALETALDAYGVVLPEQQKVASAAVEPSADEYVLPERKRWRVTSCEDVKLAEAALRGSKSSLSIEEQAGAAVRLAKFAEVHGAALDDDTLRTAGLTMSDLDTTREWVEVRASMTADERSKVAYTALASGLAKTNGVSNDRPALIKLASALNELDKTAGFSAAQKRSLYGPLETVFNSSVKLATATVDINGKAVSLAKLAALPASFYGDAFGDDVVAELTTNGQIDPEKVATIVPTMPRDLLQTFARHATPYLR